MLPAVAHQLHPTMFMFLTSALSLTRNRAAQSLKQPRFGEIAILQILLFSSMHVILNIMSSRLFPH